MKLFSSWQELPFQSRSSTTCGPCLAERILSAKTWILFDHSNVPALSIGVSNWFGSCEVSRSSFSEAFLQGRSSCSHSASIFFSMDSFQTSPERGVQNKTHLPRWRLRCLWWWLTSKQSLKVVQGPRHYNWFYRCTLIFKTWLSWKAAWLFGGKMYFCQFLESTPEGWHCCGWIRSEGNCQQIVQSTGYFRTALHPDRNETIQLMTRIAVSVKTKPSLHQLPLSPWRGKNPLSRRLSRFTFSWASKRSHTGLMTRMRQVKFLVRL